jgi:phage repressor protein C with HTH and peptisase S24 domain
MCVKERVKMFTEYKKMTISKFEEVCDLSNGYIAAMRKGFGQEKLNNVLTAFPELNREWLLYGEGEMLKVPAVLTVYNPTAEDAKAVEAGMELKMYPAEIVKEIREEVKAEIEEAESIPIISSKVANDVSVNVRKFVEKRGDEMERIKPKDLIGEANIAERIRKGSMMPTFMPGDIVFVQFLDDKRVISDGHTYYFDLAGRPTIIRKVKFEGDKLRLIAENPEFGDIITTFDDIENVADIVGMFRSFFSNQYADIEAVRRRKDEQVDKLIEQNGEALRIISSMLNK